MCYNFIVVRAHNSIETLLRDNGLITQLPPLPVQFQVLEQQSSKEVPISLVDNTYADDGCFFVSHKRPDIMIDYLRQVVRIVHNVYMSYGLGVNFKPGKSEAVFQLRGPGKDSIMSTLVNDNQSRLPFQASTIDIPADYSGLFLRLVRAYKHMGTTSVGLADNNYESKVRSAIMHGELRKSRSKI